MDKVRKWQSLPHIFFGNTYDKAGVCTAKMLACGLPIPGQSLYLPYPIAAVILIEICSFKVFFGFSPGSDTFSQINFIFCCEEVSLRGEPAPGPQSCCVTRKAGAGVGYRFKLGLKSVLSGRVVTSGNEAVIKSGRTPGSHKICIEPALGGRMRVGGYVNYVWIRSVKARLLGVAKNSQQVCQ